MIQEVGWNQVQCNTAKLLSDILEATSFQLEPDTKSPLRFIPDADIPEEGRVWLQELLDSKYIGTVSQTTTDIGRTNLIELDIPAEGPPITSKPYTVPLKYCEFMDHKNKQLEEAGIISRIMSNLASPILVVPKNEEYATTTQQVVVKIVSSICNCVLTIESLTVKYEQLTRLKPIEVWVQ